MQVYVQGTVDYFCGVYAIINAMRWALRGRKTLSYSQGCAFYQHMMQHIINVGRLEQTLYHGAHTDDLVEYMDVACQYVKEKFGIKVVVTRPFVNTDKSVQEATDEMGELLKQKGTAVLIRVHNQTIGDHWSVATEKNTRSELKLFDSYLYKKFDTKTTKWCPLVREQDKTPDNPTGMPKPPKKTTYILKEGQFFFKVVD